MDRSSHNNRPIVVRMVKAFLLSILMILLFGLPLFLSAGSLRFANAWLFLGTITIPGLLLMTYQAVKDPDLFEKRMKVTEEDKFQTLLKLLLTLTFIITLIISGLDYRYQWSSVPLFFVVFFTFVILFGTIMLFIVIKQNSYASRTIEIQENQHVIETGLYSVVRHPMYLAFTIIFCFSPLVLGSFCAFILALLMPILIALRIRNEEQLLQKDLDGYEAYMSKVRYRLIPYIW
jgi:protein-S-isoprenylcysteine O-methyltransferase Ste14